MTTDELTAAASALHLVADWFRQYPDKTPEETILLVSDHVRQLRLDLDIATVRQEILA